MVSRITMPGRVDRGARDEPAGPPPQADRSIPMMEENVPRAPWRRRGTTDSPRPGGRRWAGRLRRGGAFARQVLLVRVGRRAQQPEATGVLLSDQPGGAVEHRDVTGYRRALGGYRRGLGGIATPDPFSLDSLAEAELAGLVPGGLATTDPAGPPIPVSPAVGPIPPAPARPATGRPSAPVPPVTARPASPLPPTGQPTDGATGSLLPGEHTLARRIKFAVVNACTLTSLTLGMLAIFLAMQGDVRVAAGCLIACVAFDGLDGALARRMGVSSPFGAQMDSLADMCSFGLAAPVVLYASLAGSVSTAAAAVACALVAACAAIRLARFNVSPKDGRFFSGVPTTMAAAVLALWVLIGLPVSGSAQVAGAGLLAFAMVSSFPYAKLARLIKLPPWVWLAPVVGALIDIRLTFALVVVGYLASGPLLWLREQRRAA